MPGIGDLVNVIAGHKVMPDAKDTYKNVIAPATRIVTDTAIDLADVVTGTQFHGDMEGAKRTLDEAGIDTTATRIKENHYPEIKRLQSDLTGKQAQITQLQGDISSANAGLSGRIDIHNQWVHSVQIIQGLQDEFKRVMERLGEVKSESFNITLPNSEIKQVDISEAFIRTRDALKYTNMGVGGLSTITAVASLAAKSAQVAKLAGRASAVLMVVSIGLDVGMAIAQLEEQKKQLQQTNNEADTVLTKSRSILGEIQSSRVEVDANINNILKACSPPQSEATFSSWAEKTIDDLKQVIKKGKAELHALLVNALTPLVNAQLDLADIQKAAHALLPSLSDDEFRDLIKEINHK